MNIKIGFIRRILSVVLCTVLAVPAVLSFPAASYAAIEDGDTEAVKEMAYHVYKTPDVVYYSDDFFRGDSKPYNVSLAAMSYAVCNMTYGTNRSSDKENQSRNLREFLTDNGFTDFDVNDDYKTAASLESSAVACAHKKISDGDKTFTLLAVIPRSGTIGKEFERSLILSKSGNDKGDHAGYDACKDKVVSFVRQYVKEYGIKGDLKVWTTGYSGGGGVSNLFAAELIKYPAYVAGNPSFSSSDLYCYNFSPMRAASVDSDPKDEKYDCIHNIYDDADILSILPTSDRFDRYGTDYRFRDHADKDKTLELMQVDSESIYESYVNGGDPDLFTAFKPDTEELKKGNLVLLEDDDSYIPEDMAIYIKSIEGTIKDVCAQEGGGNSRKGFYKVYQQPMMDLVGYFFRDGINYKNIGVLTNALTKTKTSVPLLLSMYTSFMLDKSIDNHSKALYGMIGQSFSRMASLIENEDGSLKDRYRLFTAYESIRDDFFTRSDDADSKYVLKSSLSNDQKKLLMSSLKKLTGSLYAASLKTAMKEAGEDEETIAKLTSEDSSEAASWFLANLVFGNGLQSSEIEPLKFDNEQFCQMATFMGNFDRYVSMHMYYYLFSWYRAADPYYADFSKGTEAQCTGYRRVFIDLPAGSYSKGTVTDGSGEAAAEFRDGEIISRSDQWIGMTTSDSGSWLRLPIDESYKVSVTLSKDASASLKTDDYSITDGEVKRSVTGDDSGSWSKMKVKAGETLTLDIPAAPYTEGEYDLTGAVYTLSRKAPSVSVPAVKNVKAKAGKKCFTVRWKKLSSAQLKKISSIQVQYSTNKSFKSARTVSVSRNKTLYKAGGLEKGKTYYIRVRNVKKVGGKTYTSGWSKTIKVKVK